MQQQLEEARELLRTARFEAVSASLAGSEDWPSPFNEQAVIVRAEALMRRDPILALELLARLNDLFTTATGRFDYYVTSGRAYANARNLETAAEMFEMAANIDQQNELNRAPELAHHRARLLWFMNRCEPEHPDVVLALTSPDPGSRMLTLVVRAWMHAGLGNYRGQITDLRAAVALAREHPTIVDAYTVGRALHSLLRIGCELGDSEAVADAEQVYNTMDWTEDLADAQFLCLRALAWDAFLNGNSARAQWLLRDSKDIAPSDAWKVMAHVDRAYIARMNRNEGWAREEVLQAQELARGVAWASTMDEERQALVTLAVLLAPIDMAQAQRFVSIHMRIGAESLDPSLAIAHDRRADAFAQYAWGNVHHVLGNKQSAANAFEKAYRIFSETEHHFRAALAAHGLGEVVGGSVWTERARQHAVYFPKSAFYRFLTERASAPASPWIEGLSPMRRQLALALCEGLDSPRLSQRFSRSEFTIKREVQSLFDTFGVRSRNSLRELLEAQGAL